MELVAVEQTGLWPIGVYLLLICVSILALPPTAPHMRYESNDHPRSAAYTKRTGAIIDPRDAHAPDCHPPKSIRRSRGAARL
jgi:hypothetical protein